MSSANIALDRGGLYMRLAQRIGVELEARGQMLSTINSTNPTPTNSRKRHGIVFEPMPIFGKHDVYPHSNTWGLKRHQPFVRAGRSMR